MNTSLSDNEQKSDSNNNNLKKPEILDTSQTSSNATAIRKNTLTTLSETSSTNTQQTAIINQDPNAETDINLNQEPNLTSTPQTSAKQTDNNKKNTESMSSNQHTDDENEKFYDHDEVICQNIPQKIENSDLSNGKPVMDNLVRIDLKKVDDNRNKYFNYFVVLACFGFISYLFYLSNTSNSSLITRIMNNVYFFFGYLKYKLTSLITSSEYSQSLSQPRWVQWPLVTSNSTLDPLISWFLTKYRPNN